MPLEPDFDAIDSLNPAFPDTTDEVNEGDNHIRGVKNALKNNVSGSVTATQLRANDATVLNADDQGAQVTGQVSVSEAVPLNPDELTRKDYVDLLADALAVLQLEVDANAAAIADMQNGFEFTGPISAPVVTQTT